MSTPAETVQALDDLASALRRDIGARREQYQGELLRSNVKGTALLERCAADARRAYVELGAAFETFTALALAAPTKDIATALQRRRAFAEARQNVLRPQTAICLTELVTKMATTPEPSAPPEDAPPPGHLDQERGS